MVISIASGKGGTGKTTIATNLALSLAEAKLLDCDVEEPNSYLFIRPKIEKSFPVSIPVPRVDAQKCNLCGCCQKVCAYNAIALVSPARGKNPPAGGEKTGKVLVFDDLCRGCGACSYLCPQGAISEVEKKIGVVETGRRGSLEFVDGKLDIGQAMAPPIIRGIKKYTSYAKTTIIDVPPGTSCPVIEAVEGSDFSLLVTEPTLFGLNDLKLAVLTFRKLKIPFAVVINRSDLGSGETKAYCKKENIPVLLEIPFDRRIASVYSSGGLIIEEFPEYKKRFTNLLENIKKISEEE